MVNGLLITPVNLPPNMHTEHNSVYLASRQDSRDHEIQRDPTRSSTSGYQNIVTGAE